MPYSVSAHVVGRGRGDEFGIVPVTRKSTFQKANNNVSPSGGCRQGLLVFLSVAQLVLRPVLAGDPRPDGAG